MLCNSLIGFEDSEVHAFGGWKQRSHCLKVVPLAVPHLDGGVVRREILPEMPRRDQVYPAALIELERRCQLVATSDEESPLKDFVRDFLLRVRPFQ
jgi:hypothetical protein